MTKGGRYTIVRTVYCDVGLHSLEARGLGTQLRWGTHHSSASIGGTRPRDPAVLGAHHSSASIGGTRPRDPVTSFIRGTLPRVSHFIARGLVNQPCWWAHRSSKARGLVIQSGALHWSEARGLKTQSLHCTRPRKPAVLVGSSFIEGTRPRDPVRALHWFEARGLVIQSGHFIGLRHAASVGGSSFVGLVGGTSFVRGTRPHDSVTSLHAAS